MNHSLPRPAHRFSEQFPEISKGPLGTWIYMSDDLYDKEAQMFASQWLCIGRTDQISSKGQFFVKDVYPAKASIIVVRDRGGEIRAFHNVCRHRGNKVVWEESGKCGAFTCKFHGWSYRLDGSLADVPDEERFFDFDKADNGLMPVHVDTWRGFIFICLAKGAPEPLKQFLGKLGTELEDYPFESYPVCAAYRVRIRCNWKIVVDAFQEGYHVPRVHSRSLVDYHYESDLHLFKSVELYDHHASFAMNSAKEHHATPAELLGFKYSANIASAVSQVKSDRDENTKQWGFVLNRIFPNFFCDVLDGLYFTHEILPISKDETWYEHRMYFAQPTTAAGRFGTEVSKVMLRDALLEDLSTLEQTQAATEGGSLDRFVLQDEEIVLRHFYKVLGEMVGVPDFEPRAKAAAE